MGVNASCPINIKCPESLSCSCKQRAERDTPPPSDSHRVVFMYDEEDDDEGLVVLGPGTMDGGRLTVSDTETVGPWDVMDVDHNGRVVLLYGPMLPLVAVGQLGNTLDDTFCGSFRTVLKALHDIVVDEGRQQLNCVYKRRTMTLMVYPLPDGTGVHYICRPTAYDTTDIERILGVRPPVVLPPRGGDDVAS